MQRLLGFWLAGWIALSGAVPAGAAEVRQALLPEPATPLASAGIVPITAPATAAQLPELPALARLPSPAVAGVEELPQAVAPASPTSPSATAQLEATAQEPAPAQNGIGAPAEPAGRGFFDGDRLRRKASDLAEMGQVAVAAHFVSIFPNALLNGTAAHPLAMGALWYGASEGMASMLAESRRTVVGGWQASHDQRYRVDPNTGLLRDVRGHKYGSDRYEQYAPGKVSPAERLLATAVSAAMGFLWISPDLKSTLAYVAVFGLTAALAALLRAHRRPSAPFVPTDEDKAHAGRFRP